MSIGEVNDKEAKAPEDNLEAGYNKNGHAPCMMGDMELDAETCEFYRTAVLILTEEEIPFLVGGAYALQRYTGISRHTKDFDVFMKPEDVERALAALGQSGCETEMTFTHWLGKAYCGDLFVDIIFRSGNGVSEVDDEWFANGTPDEVLGIPVQLCPPEEIIWTKAFVQERERFDGADIAHLIRARAEDLDWKRLVRRFGTHWRVLFSHLVMFGFIYPGERDKVPAWVMNDFMGRLQIEMSRPAPRTNLIQGTLVTRQQYLIDIDQWGYRDARLQPRIMMTEEEIEAWTAGIEVDGK